ncbi:tRNA-(ms[2]io[6]A)-hydroxylase [Ohtaekwangia kribbensis]|jgi:tRNA-(ms[2]io[6]A)-hydroxylase|uniref:tRNA-(Ms[2]io[6]A)-hydroxylase n=1 Tax=Ohtaekwangia kribbensis TaxID=688913 RepID=A0ABW3KE24_9BACT
MEAKDKFTLGLELPTDPRWINIAELHLEDILVDHAYCEQKAASSGISLIIQYPEKDILVERLTAIVAEEWGHFERVVAELRKRGWKLGKQRKDEYVVKLNEVIQKGGSREQQLMEKLLLNALIEARSCERFKILWKNIPDKELAEFYHELMISEAGHYKNFLQLAKEYMPEDVVMNRWHELLEQEAKIVESLAVRGDRMH